MTDVIVKGSVRMAVLGVNFDVRPTDLIEDGNIFDPHHVLSSTFQPRVWECERDAVSEVGVVALKFNMTLKEIIHAWDHGSLLSLVAVLRLYPHIPNVAPLYAMGHSMLMKEGTRKSTCVPKVVTDSFPRCKITLHDTRMIFLAGSRFLVCPSSL